MLRLIFSFIVALFCLITSLGSNFGFAKTIQTNLIDKANIQKLDYDANTAISHYSLKSNKLNILLVPRHTTPVVTAMVLYHVGSRNEAVGYTGATHFLEHMLFKGTTKHDPQKHSGIDDLLKPTGGFNNASTYYDRTNYYEVVPANNLELCLELEADRMRNALLRVSDRNLEMTVVRNELERNEDSARNMLETNVFATAFREHPYHHPVIGWRSDVENVPIERLRKFYKDYYVPNNATLIVIGDFKSDHALKLIAKYFGSIPASTQAIPTVYTLEPEQEGQRRFFVQRGNDLAKIMIGFHIPAAKDKDTYGLEVIASLLGNEKRHSSRLYKALVDTGLVSEVYAYNYSLHDPGLFAIYATACPGVNLQTIEKTIFAELTNLSKEKISIDELSKAKQFIWKRINIAASDPLNMAEQLTEAIATVNWQWWLNLTGNIKAVTLQDIDNLAHKYFDSKMSTIGYYFPRTEKEPTCCGATDTTQKTSNSQLQSTSYLNKQNSHQQQKLALLANKINSMKNKSIANQVKRYVLNNGLTILVLPVPNAKVVAINGKILAGSYFRSPEFTLVPDLVADMLTKGSYHWTKDSISSELENLGTVLNFSADDFWLEFNSEIVSVDINSFLPILADVLKNPTFSNEELDKAIRIMEANIQESEADTEQVALNKFLQAQYHKNCVYYQKSYDLQKAELTQINSSQLKTFHKNYVLPNNTVIAIVGDIDPDYAYQAMEKYFSDWLPGEKHKINEINCLNNSLSKITSPIFSNLLDKTNANILIGHPVDISICSKEFFAFQVANAILGHDTISSRLAEIREKYGLTYGIASYLSDTSYKYAPWFIELSVNPENINKAIKLVNSTVNTFIKQGITQKELNEETSRLAGEYIVNRLRTPGQIASGLTRYEFLGLGPQFIDNYAKQLKLLNVADVNKAIKKYFVINSSLTSVAGTLPAK